MTLHGDRKKYQMNKRMQLLYHCIKVKFVKMNVIIIVINLLNVPRKTVLRVLTEILMEVSNGKVIGAHKYY